MPKHVDKILERAEFFVVIAGALGYPILGSITSFLLASPAATITEAGLQGLLVYETITLALVGGFLYQRGWTIDQLGIRPTVKDMGIGVLLAAASYLIFEMVSYITFMLAHGLEQQANSLVVPNLRLATVVTVSILNPVFEEVIVCAYVITALKKTRSDSFAINISIGIRMAYHLYQGAIGFISIIPMGFIFAYWFLRTRRVWPVIVAHALLDIIAFVTYAQ